MVTASEEFLSPEEVGDRLGVSVYTVRRWIKTGQLRAFKPGKEYRIQASDLEEFIRAREVRPKARRRSPLEQSFNDVLAEERRWTEKAAYWLETLTTHADAYEEVLQGGAYSLDLIQKEAYAGAELVGLYSRFHRKELQEVASDEQWRALEATKERLRSLRRELREAARKKFEEEREKLSERKVVEMQRRAAEIDRLVEQEEREVS